MEAAASPMVREDVRGETVGEVAHGRVRADILFGRLAPGERLRLEAVSLRYATSITTMREILSRLGSEGLIVAEGQRGFEVAPVSGREFREVADLRYLLEAHALSHSFRQGDLDWEASVVAAHHKLAVMEHRMLEGSDASPELWKACDRAFHHALISACGSQVLMAAHSAAYDKYLRYQMIAVVFRGEAAAREHGILLDCALKRDSDRATEILRTHIDSCVEYALGKDAPAWAAPRTEPASGRAYRPRNGQPKAQPSARRPAVKS